MTDLAVHRLVFDVTTRERDQAIALQHRISALADRVSACIEAVLRPFDDPDVMVRIQRLHLDLEILRGDDFEDELLESLGKTLLEKLSVLFSNTTVIRTGGSLEDENVSRMPMAGHGEQSLIHFLETGVALDWATQRSMTRAEMKQMLEKSEALKRRVVEICSEQRESLQRLLYHFDDEALHALLLGEWFIEWKVLQRFLEATRQLLPNTGNEIEIAVWRALILLRRKEKGRVDVAFLGRVVSDALGPKESFEFSRLLNGIGAQREADIAGQPGRSESGGRGDDARELCAEEDRRFDVAAPAFEIGKELPTSAMERFDADALQALIDGDDSAVETLSAKIIEAARRIHPGAANKLGTQLRRAILGQRQAGKQRIDSSSFRRAVLDAMGEETASEWMKRWAAEENDGDVVSAALFEMSGSMGDGCDTAERHDARRMISDSTTADEEIDFAPTAQLILLGEQRPREHVVLSDASGDDPITRDSAAVETGTASKPADIGSPLSAERKAEATLVEKGPVTAGEASAKSEAIGASPIHHRPVITRSENVPGRVRPTPDRQVEIAEEGNVSRMNARGKKRSDAESMKDRASRPTVHLYQSEDAEASIQTHYYLHNAGIVLVAPFLGSFFKNLGLIEAGRFIDGERQRRAAVLLHRFHGETEIFEGAMILHKLLCGLSISSAVPVNLDLTKSESAEIYNLIEALIRYWKALKNTSVDAFRYNFFNRKALLTRDDFQWRLHIQKESIDVLLSTLPWPITTIKHEWMPKPIMVVW